MKEEISGVDSLIDAILLMKIAQIKTGSDNEAWYKLYRAQLFLAEEIRSTITLLGIRRLILKNFGYGV